MAIRGGVFLWGAERGGPHSMLQISSWRKPTMHPASKPSISSAVGLSTNPCTRPSYLSWGTNPCTRPSYLSWGATTLITITKSCLFLYWSLTVAFSDKRNIILAFFLPPAPERIRISGWRGVFTKLEYLILNHMTPGGIRFHQCKMSSDPSSPKGYRRIAPSSVRVRPPAPQVHRHPGSIARPHRG
jgi:hypothetical protein